MKKRVKLLTTIASLCLAVALMAFGVYAASTAQFNVQGSVSFTASPHVYLTYSGYELKTLDVTNVDTTKADGWELGNTQIPASQAATDYKWDTVVDTTLNNPDAVAPIGELTGFTFDFKDPTTGESAQKAIYAYQVTLTFTAIRDMENLTVELTDTNNYNNVNYTSKTSHTAGEGIEAADTLTVTIVCSLVDVATSVTAKTGEGIVEMVKTQIDFTAAFNS